MKYCPYLVGLIRGSAKTVCSRVQARAKTERKRIIVSKFFWNWFVDGKYLTVTSTESGIFGSTATDFTMRKVSFLKNNFAFPNGYAISEPQVRPFQISARHVIWSIYYTIFRTNRTMPSYISSALPLFFWIPELLTFPFLTRPRKFPTSSIYLGNIGNSATAFGDASMPLHSSDTFRKIFFSLICDINLLYYI